MQPPAELVPCDRDELPRSCFISHSYKDKKERKALIASLPAHVHARTFPPISVDPDKRVSDELVAAIMECEGLIYLASKRSAQSFWVAFERDYALRAGKRVFAASGPDFFLAELVGKPLDLATFPSYHLQDRSRVREFSEYLRKERFFDLWSDDDALVGDALARAIASSIDETNERGGYVIVFWSTAARDSQFVENEIQSAVKGMEGANDRVLFALLDDTPLPDFWDSQESAVQLYSDDQRTAHQRMDDLVVRLYWLIWKKTQFRSVGDKRARRSHRS